MGSKLTMVDDTVGGNVEAHKAGLVWLVFTIVDGDVRIAGGVGDPEESVHFRLNRATLTRGSVFVTNNSGLVSVRDNMVLEGSIHVDQNGPTTAVLRNVVARIIQVSNNGPGGTTVRANTAGESINCEGNASIFAELNDAPFLAGQCAAPTTPE